MSEFDRREAEKRDAERSKNDLEAYIISTGGILEDGAYDEVDFATLGFHSRHDVRYLLHLYLDCMRSLSV